MNLRRVFSLLALAMLVVGAQQLSGQTLGTSFTYQGRLMDAGQPAEGNYDLAFTVFGSADAGPQIGAPIIFNNFSVTDGLFTVDLDFGPDVFNGNNSPGKRWLEIEVDGIALSPRQSLKGSPYSIQTRGLAVAEDGGGMRVGVGRVANNFADTLGVYADTTNFGGMTVETPAGGNPSYAYQSGSNQSVYHYLDHDDQAWRLRNAGERIFVDSNGFVGVNKDTQAHSTEVFGVYKSTTGTAGIMMETDEFGDPYFGYATAGTHHVFHSYDGDDEQWKIYVRDSGASSLTPRVYINKPGNVGIGFSQPALRLMVNGDAGKPGGGSWSNVSDRRLKKNVKDLNGSLQKLLKLRGVTFEYLDPEKIGELQGERIGVIAQEVEEIFPDWVGERSNGYKHVTFRGFEALTVEALRELRSEKDQQIKSLEAENQDLRAAKDEMQVRLDALELQMQQLMASQQSK